MTSKIKPYSNKVSNMTPVKVSQPSKPTTAPTATAGGVSVKKTVVMAQERDEASIHTASVNDEDEIEFHEHGDDDHYEDSDDEKPDIKDKTFEFTSSNDIMRMIRMCFFIQIIAIALDNPTVIIPPLFRIAVNGLCFYSLRFFSRPFLDLVYAVQYYSSILVKYANRYVPSGSSTGFSIVVGWNIPYIDRVLRGTEGSSSGSSGDGGGDATATATAATAVGRILAGSSSGSSSETVDVVSDRIWHSLKFFSQFWLAVLFTVMAALFAFRMWEIKDYTDSKEVQIWLRTYVADGWVRRGGLRLARSITIGCVCLAAFLMFILGVSNDFFFQPSMPSYAMASTTFAIFLSILVIIWFIGYRGFRATEAAFVRYVSQNVNYTSTIILKRAVKTKTEIALALMFLLYMPALYTFLQSVIVIMDWNDAFVASHRMGVNYYVPCYFMAFPPFRHTHKPIDQCSVASSVNQDWFTAEYSHYGFYKDERMVQCDSYFGMAMYTTGLLCFVFLMVFYGWMFHNMIHAVILEFQSSRWVEPYQILFSKTYVENMRFEESFSWVEVKRMALFRELHYQIHQWALAYAFILLQATDFAKGTVQLLLSPLVCIVAPFAFFGKRIALLLCNCWTVEGRTRAALDERARIRTLHARRKKMERDGYFKPNTPYSDRVAMASAKLGMRNPLADSTSLSARLGLGGLGLGASMKNLFSTRGYGADDSDNGYGNPGAAGIKPTSSSSSRLNSSSPDFDDVQLETPGMSRPGTSDTEAMGLQRVGLETPQTMTMSGRFMTPMSTVGGVFASLSSKLRSPFSSKERFEEDAMFDRNRAQIADTTTYVIEHGHTFEDEQEYIEKELPPITPAVDIIIRNIIWMLKCCGGWALCMKCWHYIGEIIWKWLLKTWIVSYTRMKFHFLLEYLRGNDSNTLVGLGTDKKLHGAWRKQLQFEARERTVYLLRQRLEHELKKARAEFITDHQLIISIFDYVIDSSGIFMLISQYKWDRLWFSIVIWIEMTLYAMFAAPANYLLIWQTKLKFIAAVNVFMIMFNYAVQPYSISGDRWLDFLGRVLVIGVCGGFLLEAIIMPSSISEADMPANQYAPWVSYSYIISLDPVRAGVYLLVDGCMVICTYFYILGVLNFMGVFAALKRQIQLFLHSFHDHILDFLVRKLDERTIGPENVYSGLSVVQQWDDIIRHQRRYALLPVPDVRPSNLLPWSQKMLQVKWASLFNLNVANIRSSLGLTLLHTAMCSADGEVCRWLIHFYPELLTVEDSQRDTPIGISLKECAYNLLRYSKMNNGRLDDGTSYEDDQFFQYYEEIEPMREEIRVYGEFLEEFADTYILDSKEAIQLHNQGYFDQTPVVVEEDQEKKAREARMNMTGKQKRMMMIRGGGGGGSIAGGKGRGKMGVGSSTASVTSGGGNSALSKMFEEMNKPKFKFGLQPKQEVIKVKEQTVVSGGITKKVKVCRFPEDSVNNNFESGQMGCWSVLGLTVPDVNLFVDRTLTAHKFYDIEQGLDKDIRYVIESCNVEPPRIKRFRANISGVVARSMQNEQVPYDHPAMKLMKDWGSDLMIPKTMMERVQQKYKNFIKGYNKAKKSLGCGGGNSGGRRGGGGNARGMRYSDSFVDRDPDNKNSDSERGSNSESDSEEEEEEGALGDHEVSSWASGQNDYGLGHGRTKMSHAAKKRARKERQYKWKICKFAEILLSTEVLEKCEHLHWDLAAYKALSKLSSQLQGRIAHSLALVFNLNPPVGFARFSDWSCGVPAGEYEDGFQEGKQEQNVVVAGVLKVGETVEKVRGTVKNLGEFLATLARGKGGYVQDNETVFNDRIVQYLAECYVCSRERCVLVDCELSGPGRIAYRAICRAMRLHNSTFVLPSVFVGAKVTCVRYLELQKNELDCGDVIVLAEAVAAQQELMYLDLSYNRIGSRGMKALIKVLKTHKSITTLKADHNRIGPAVGIDFGLFLKNTKSLKVLSLAHNRMGPMIRYTSPSVKEKIPGAMRDLMTGFKNNKGLQYLDLSYNHFGPEHVEYIVVALNKHTNIMHIELAGNDIGPDKGPSLLFCLAGQPGGDHQIKRREMLIERMKELEKQKLEEGDIGKPSSGESTAAKLGITEAKKKKKKKTKKKEGTEANQQEDSQTLTGDNDEEEDEITNRPSCLAHIGLAENQLGVLAAHGVAALLKRNKSMTSLDISGNAFGPCGGLIITEAFERVLNITSRDEIKRALDEMQKQIMQGRNQVTKKLVYSNLTALNMSRNGLGPAVCASLMYCLAAPNCTIVSLDISNNPMGFSIPNAGDAILAAADCRSALGKNMSLTHLNFSKTLFQPTQLVSIFGGLAMNVFLREIHLGDMILDEPDCLQLSHAIDVCQHLSIIDIPNSQMGPKGAKLILHQIDLHKRRIKYVDMSNGNIGLLGVIPLAKILADHHCAIKVLKIQNNMLLDEGGEYMAKSLQGNHVLTELNISSNQLGRSSGLAFGDLARGIHKDGRKICQSPLKIVDFSDNPNIGYQASRFLADGFVLSDVERINLSNIGAGPAMGTVLAGAFRHATMTWRWVDISKNLLTRVGMNEICWSMRMNRVIRVLKMGDNDVGLRFVTQDDALGVHGIALPRVIRENVTLRELDLSHLGLCSEAGILIFEAMASNFTIRKFTIRNNFLDDEASYALSEMLRYNDIVEELDIGDNQFSYNGCFVLAECLETNHSLHKLVVDKNRLGSAGSATVEAFCFALNMNCRLRILILDNNRLGPEWGSLLADTLCRNNTLVRVSLLDNRLDIRSGGALLRAYTHNSYLLELGVSSDEVGDMLFTKFQELQRQKRSILTIDDIKKETMVEHELSKMLFDYY